LFDVLQESRFGGSGESIGDTSPYRKLYQQLISFTIAGYAFWDSEQVGSEAESYLAQLRDRRLSTGLVVV
jgi:hypothetical protein